MTLRQWLENKWLNEHKTSPQEIKSLLGVIERDLRDSQVEGISADWKLAIAFNAILQCGIAALAARGYRPARGASHHYYTIESLRVTLGTTEDDVRTIATLGRKRNIADYEMAGAISSGEAEEAADIARQTFERLRVWLAEKHRDLLTTM